MRKIDDSQIIELNNLGLSAKEMATKLEVSVATVKRLKAKLNLKSQFFSNKHENQNCLLCKKEFVSLKRHNRKFCSLNCSATFNNLKKNVDRTPEKISSLFEEYNVASDGKTYRKKCLYCETEYQTTCSYLAKIRKYCSNKCQQNHKQSFLFKKLESGEYVNSRIAKLYLIKKFGAKCMDCGWDKKNVITGNVPIELELIDGNSENNSLENLKLLCPNCHSLTPTYKALNKGNGRHKRRERYLQGKSF